MTEIDDDDDDGDDDNDIRYDEHEQEHSTSTINTNTTNEQNRTDAHTRSSPSLSVRTYLFYHLDDISLHICCCCSGESEFRILREIRKKHIGEKEILVENQ